MICEMFDTGFQPLRLSSTRLLVCDDNGTPIALFFQTRDGRVRYCHAGEEDFAAELRRRGVDRSVVVTRVDLDNLKPPPVKK